MELVCHEVTWYWFTWHLMAPYAAQHCPRNNIGSPLCYESALLPEEQTVSFWLWGHVRTGAVVGKPQEMEMGRKACWCWCTLFCSSSCDQMPHPSIILQRCLYDDITQESEGCYFLVFFAFFL